MLRRKWKLLSGTIYTKLDHLQWIKTKKGLSSNNSNIGNEGKENPKDHHHEDGERIMEMKSAWNEISVHAVDFAAFYNFRLLLITLSNLWIIYDSI